MKEKSIYERALEEIDKQRLKKARKRFVKKKHRRRKKKKPLPLKDVDVEGLKKVLEEAKKTDIHFDGPPSVPPNVRHSCPRDILLDGASNRGWGRSGGGRRNIQLD
jgi:hypothetical protein